MARPDLVSEKTLMTNPDQGFGDAAVAPYIHRGFDDSIYQHLGAIGARQAQERDAKAKRDLELASKLGKVSDDTKGNPALQAKSSQFRQYLGQKIDRGESISHQELADMQGQLEIDSAKNIAEKQQYDTHLSDTIPSYSKTYGDAYNKGLANMDATNGYWKTPLGGFKAEADPTVATHLYDLPVATQEFAKNYANIFSSKQSNESSAEDPEKASSYSNSTGSVFMIADPNNKNRQIPGVGQVHVNEFLNEKNGVAAKKIDKEIIQPQYAADAITIKEKSKTDPAFSKYALMTPDQITNDLLENGNPLRKGSNGVPLNQAGFRNQVAKQQLEAYNKKSISTVISNEDKAPGYDSTYGSNASNKFLATPGTFAQESPGVKYTTSPDGKVTKTESQTKRFNIPGIATTKDGATLKSISINPNQYRDVSGGEIIKDPKGRFEYTPQHLGTTLMKDGRAFAGTPEQVVASLNNETEKLRKWYEGGQKGPKPSGFAGWIPTQVSSGYVDTKLNTEGKSPEKLQPGETVVDAYDPESGQKIQMIRKTVSIPIRQGDDVETYLNAQSGNSLRNRKLTPEEQSIQDAWEKLNKAYYGIE